MSDPQEVKATVIEPCDKLDVQHVDVPDVVSNVEAVKAWVDGELAKYGAFEIPDEDSYKTAKAQRAEVRKLKSAVDAERKRVKSAYDRPLKAFEAQVKTITGPIDKLDGAMKEQISAYEEQCEQAQRADLEEYYTDMAGIIADSLPYCELARIKDPKGSWLKRSNFTKAEAEIGHTLGDIKGVLETIDIMDLSDDERRDIKADYLSCLDFTAAGKRIQERRDAQERVMELEAQQAAIRDAQRRPVQPEPEPVQAAPEPYVSDPGAKPAPHRVTYAIIMPSQQVGGLSSEECNMIIDVFKRYGFHGTKRAEVR
jgi:hypothetical protein